MVFNHFWLHCMHTVHNVACSVLLQISHVASGLRSGLCACLYFGHTGMLCKIGWTVWDAIWGLTGVVSRNHIMWMLKWDPLRELEKGQFWGLSGPLKSNVCRERDHSVLSDSMSMTAAADCNILDWSLSHYIVSREKSSPAMRPSKILWPLFQMPYAACSIVQNILAIYSNLSKLLVAVQCGLTVTIHDDCLTTTYICLSLSHIELFYWQAWRAKFVQFCVA